jgi:predicted MPP superfamily phosphohydrolase
MRLAIGDIHGRNFWKHYLKRDFTEFFFTGDYFDSFNLSFPRQYKNFTEICALARKDERIKLCLGNHDYHYLSGVYGQQYSGFQFENYRKINEVLEENMDLLGIVRVSGGQYLISHAGVTNYFLNSLDLRDPGEINAAFLRDRNILNFKGSNIYGNDITQSPIWIRPESLQRDALSGYNQIVGHTPVHKISQSPTADGKNKLVFIDTHDIESVYEF